MWCKAWPHTNAGCNITIIDLQTVVLNWAEKYILVRAHPKPDVAANLWPKHGISDPGTWGIAMSIITYTYIHIYIYIYTYIYGSSNCGPSIRLKDSKNPNLLVESKFAYSEGLCPQVFLAASVGTHPALTRQVPQPLRE